MALDNPVPTCIPLAVLLRTAALECEAPHAPLHPLSYRAYHQRHRAHLPHTGTLAAHHWREQGPVRLLTLNRFCVAGAAPDFDYFDFSQSVLAVQARNAHQRPPAMDRLRHTFNPDGQAQSFHYHGDAGLSFALDPARVLDTLAPMQLDKCWRALARQLKADPLPHPDTMQPQGVHANFLHVPPPTLQSCFWMVLPRDLTRGGKTRPRPPHTSGLPNALPPRQHHAVCLVVNNWAEDDADLIDVQASIDRTGPGSEEDIRYICERVQHWLDLHFWDATTQDAGGGDELVQYLDQSSGTDQWVTMRAREKRAREWRETRGFNPMLRYGRSNGFTAHARHVRHAQSLGEEYDAPPPRAPGRPRLPDEVRAQREAEKSAQKAARHAQRMAERTARAPTAAPQPLGALATARRQLEAAQAELAELYRRIAAVAADLDSLPPDTVLTAPEIADGVRQFLPDPAASPDKDAR